MSTDTASALMAMGHLTLADVARTWRCTHAEAYERLFGRPMPAPAVLPAVERRTIHYRTRGSQ
jgi:hypothetical protein